MKISYGSINGLNPLDFKNGNNENLRIENEIYLSLEIYYCGDSFHVLLKFEGKKNILVLKLLPLGLAT